MGSLAIWLKVRKTEGAGNGYSCCMAESREIQRERVMGSLAVWLKVRERERKRVLDCLVVWLRAGYC